MTNRGQTARSRPPEEQSRPSLPRIELRNDRGRGRLSGKTALISGGDTGIASVIAIALAREGANIAIVYFNGHRDAEEIRQRILRENVRCILIAGDVTREDFCRNAVKRTIVVFKRLDILVNNTTEQQPGLDSRRMAAEQKDWLLSTDLLGMFCLTKAAMPHLRAHSTIINTTAVTAWRDSTQLIDDAATTRTIVSFTRSTARAVVDRRIRVNAVTPDSTDVLEEIPPTYVLLAAQDSPFMTGQVLQARAGEAAA